MIAVITDNSKKKRVSILMYIIPDTTYSHTAFCFNLHVLAKQQGLSVNPGSHSSPGSSIPLPQREKDPPVLKSGARKKKHLF